MQVEDAVREFDGWYLLAAHFFLVLTCVGLSEGSLLVWVVPQTGPQVAPVCRSNCLEVVSVVRFDSF